MPDPVHLVKGAVVGRHAHFLGGNLLEPVQVLDVLYLFLGEVEGFALHSWLE